MHPYAEQHAYEQQKCRVRKRKRREEVLCGAATNEDEREPEKRQLVVVVATVAGAIVPEAVDRRSPITAHLRAQDPGDGREGRARTPTHRRCGRVAPIRLAINFAIS